MPPTYLSHAPMSGDFEKHLIPCGCSKYVGNKVSSIIRVFKIKSPRSNLLIWGVCLLVLFPLRTQAVGTGGEGVVSRLMVVVVNTRGIGHGAGLLIRLGQERTFSLPCASRQDILSRGLAKVGSAITSLGKLYTSIYKIIVKYFGFLCLMAYTRRTMVISYHGGQCFKVSFGGTTIAFKIRFRRCFCVSLAP